METLEIMVNELFENKETMKEIDYIKKDKKTICGFECYKVKIQTKGVAKRIIEMYVTEQIDLNYKNSWRCYVGYFIYFIKR